MEQTELEKLDAFVRELYETVTIMNQRLHALAHKVVELEKRLDGPQNPLKNLGRF